jgi:antitoxin component of MazEF toxin-antitoxin module
MSARVQRVEESLGLVIQADDVQALGLAEGDVVEIVVRRKISPSELFGRFAFSMSSQETKDEARLRWGRGSSSS